MWKELITIWKSDDLLVEAWDNSYEMLQLSREMFVQSIKMLRKQKKEKTLIALKKRDKEINEFQREIRKKVMTHLVLQKDATDIPTGLILINMVIDIERVGDYCKNILDLAISNPDSLKIEKVSEDLKMIEEEVLSRFDQTMEAIHSQDSEVARELVETHRKMVAKTSDKLVDQIIKEKIIFDSESKAASVVLYARYLKRIGSHLSNIMTTLINPFEAVGYTDKKYKS
jgi:phosphate uptake regulator